MLNLLTATATDVGQLLENGQIKSERLVELYLDQIEAHNGDLHAVISTAPRSLLLERARQLDVERAAGTVRGPLHGIPMLVKLTSKDNTATPQETGLETTSGTWALVGSRVRQGAPVVNKLIEAGAIIIAKTNLSELSNFRGMHMPCGWSAVGGLTQSAYVKKRWDDGFGGWSSCGGSSSGSAVGVSAGFAPASIGTDTNGSIVMPATRADLYALKPTIGLIPQQGIVPISLVFDSAGPIAKCARDIAIMLDAMVDNAKAMNIPEGGYTSALTKSWEGIKIGVLDPKEWRMPEHVVFPDQSVYEQQQREINAAYEQLKSLALVKEVKIASFDGLNVDGMSQIQRVMDSHFKQDLESYLSDLEESKVRTLDELIEFMEENAEKELPLESPNMNRLLDAQKWDISQEDWDAALADMRDWGRRRAVDKTMEDYGVNIIIGPGDSRMNELSSTAGYPIATLPLGYLDLNTRPFGIAAVVKGHDEALMIQFMSAWETVFNKERRLPQGLASEHKL